MAMYLVAALLMVLIGSGWYAYYRIQRFSQTIFGTKSLIEGWKNQSQKLEETPKSLNGMTSLYLPLIQKDFPEFNWAEFQIETEHMLKAFLAALETGDLSGLAHASDELRHQVTNELEDLKRQGRKEFYRNIRIHKTEISRYLKREGTCVIQIQSAVEYRYSQEIQETDGADPVTEPEKREQHRYEMELVYIQDPILAKESKTAVSITCPQCGAPVTRLGSKFCEFCGAGIIGVNLSLWSLNHIEKGN